MNDKIDHMVSGDVKAVEMVIQSKGEIPHNSRDECISEINADISKIKYL